MFSGLGSFSDLNSTFAQLTNTLSLDALQQTTPAETTDPTQLKPPETSNVEKKSSEVEEVAAVAIERKVVKQFADQMVQFAVSSAEQSAQTEEEWISQTANSNAQTSIATSSDSSAAPEVAPAHAPVYSEILQPPVVPPVKVVDAETNTEVLEEQVSAALLTASEHNLQQLQERYDELQTRLETRIAELQHSLDETTQQSAHAASEKDQQIVDLTQKLTSLTDKLRELMSKYSELKTRSKESALSRDSDSVKHALRLEATQQQLEEHKDKVRDIAERFAHAQRQLLELQDENQRLTARWQARQDEEGALRMQLETLTQQTQQLEVAKRRVEDELTAQLSGLRAQFESLSHEHQTLLQRSGEEVDSASQLESYKKRSSQALKKANLAASALQQELQSEREAMQTERVVWQQQREVLEEVLRQLRSDKEVREAEVEAEAQKMHMRIVALEGHVQELQQQLQLQQETLQQQVQPPSSTSTSTVVPRQQSKGVIEEVAQDRGVEVESEEVVSEGESEEVPSRSSSAVPTHLPAPSPAVVVSAVSVEGDGGPRVDDLQEVSAVQSSGFVLVNELQEQVSALQRQLTQRSLEHSEHTHLLATQREETRRWQSKYEELHGYMQRLRATSSSSAVLSGGAQGGAQGVVEGGAPLNLEYLKACVFRFAVASEASERQRLVPVLAQLLSFTSKERAQAQSAVDQQAQQLLASNGVLESSLSSALSWLSTFSEGNGAGPSHNNSSGGSGSSHSGSGSSSAKAPK